MTTLQGGEVGRLYGLPVFVVPDRPKYQLPTDVPVSEDFRRDFDAWASDFFGTTNTVKDGEVLTMDVPLLNLFEVPGFRPPETLRRKHVFVNPRTWRQLLKATKQGPL